MFNLLCCVVLYIDSKSPIKTWLEKIHTFYLNCFEYSYIDRCLSWHVSTNFTLSQKASKAAFLWAKSKLGSGVGRQQTGVGILLPGIKWTRPTSLGPWDSPNLDDNSGVGVFPSRKQESHPSLRNVPIIRRPTQRWMESGLIQVIGHQQQIESL